MPNVRSLHLKRCPKSCSRNPGPLPAGLNPCIIIYCRSNWSHATFHSTSTGRATQSSSQSRELVIFKSCAATGVPNGHRPENNNCTPQGPPTMAISPAPPNNLISAHTHRGVSSQTVVTLGAQRSPSILRYGVFRTEQLVAPKLGEGDHYDDLQPAHDGHLKIKEKSEDLATS